MDNPPKIITGLSEISEQYEAILCDVWGVIHNGYEPFEASIKALERFRNERGPVVLITNSPRPASEIPAQFDQIGVGHQFYDAIVTSGDATRAALAARASKPVFILGPDRDLPLYDGLGLRAVALEQAEFISCTGLIHDREETPADYVDMLGQALDQGLPMVCANPDIVVMIGDRRIWCGGALAQLYEQMGGDVLYAGKPHAPIYDLCFERLPEMTGSVTDKDRILAIGDGPGTDVKGAQMAGLDCLFVATGIHDGALTETGELDPSQLARDLAQEKTRARFGAPGLIW